MIDLVTGHEEDCYVSGGAGAYIRTAISTFSVVGKNPILCKGRNIYRRLHGVRLPVGIARLVHYQFRAVTY